MFEVYDMAAGASLYEGTFEEARQWIADHEWAPEYQDARMVLRRVFRPFW